MAILARTPRIGDQSIAESPHPIRAACCNSLDLEEGLPRGVAVPNGEFGIGRERPPHFALPGSEQRDRLMYTAVPSPVRVDPVPDIPVGRRRINPQRQKGPGKFGGRP